MSFVLRRAGVSRRGFEILRVKALGKGKEESGKGFLPFDVPCLESWSSKSCDGKGPVEMGIPCAIYRCRETRRGCLQTK